MARPVVKREYSFKDAIYLVEIIKGLGITWKHFVRNVKASFRKGPHTVPTCWQYPEDRRPISPVFRGAHMLMLNEEGKELCVGCGMCARACPAKCITVKRGKAGEEDADRYAGKTYCEEFVIDELRCIFCGFCQEACPKGALMLGQGYELAEYSMEACIYDKEKLLANFHEAKEKGILPAPRKKVPVEKPPAKPKPAAAKKAPAGAKAAAGDDKGSAGSASRKAADGKAAPDGGDSGEAAGKA
jgi:NADH-quinone oxidoreductase subunit I